MEYHKKPATIIRLSVDQKAKLKEMVDYYNFSSMAELIGNIIYYGFGEFQSPETFEKTENMLSDINSKALKQVIENGDRTVNLSPSRQIIQTLVKMIGQEFGDGILYRMCESKKNDIMEYLPVAVEPWVDMIQGKFFEKFKIPVRKEDVRAGLRIWFKKSVESGEFKKALEDYLTSQIVKKLSEKQRK